VLALANRNLPASPAESEWRYRKYYEGNPLGPPLFFLAHETGSDEPVGMAAMFPTQLRVGGELAPAVITGDFAVDEGHRAFGPAIELQRACLGALAESEYVCAYGSPNVLAEPIIERVGYEDLGRLTRFVKVLRGQVAVDQYVRRRRLAGIASRASSVVLDPLLSVVSRERLHRRPAGLRVERPDAFDDRFADLWRTAARRQRVTTERSAALLNWKFERNGGREAGGAGPSYSIFALARADGAIVGYVVYRLKEEVRHIVDILALPSRRTADALLSEFILDARNENAAAISMLHLGVEHVLTKRLRSFGFLRRQEEIGVRLHAHPGARVDVRLDDPGNWSLLAGDQDL
jgi:hypothetical protein